MRQFIQNIIYLFKFWGGNVVMGAGRSSQWPKMRAEHLQNHPTCAVCGGTKKLEVHHIEPFNQKPQKELLSTNLITLCEDKAFINCHLFFGHLGNFKSWNVDVVADAAEWLKKLTNRPK